MSILLRNLKGMCVRVYLVVCIFFCLLLEDLEAVAGGDDHGGSHVKEKAVLDYSYHLSYTHTYIHVSIDLFI